MIAAANGTDSLPAVTIFAHALRFFKEHALRELSDQTAIPIHSMESITPCTFCSTFQ